MGIWNGILLFSRVGSHLCSASNLKRQLFQKAVWLCVLVRKKKRQRERTKNKTKRSPRSLHKCVLSCSAVSHSLQHKVCSHAKDACTFLRSRRTVKAVSAGYDIYPAPALCTAQPACPSQRLTPQSLSWKHPRNILDLQCELKCLLYTRLQHGV